MSWVQERLVQELENSAGKLRAKLPVAEPLPVWESTWKAICETIERDVLEFNDAHGPQFMMTSDSRKLLVIPEQPPIDTAVLQVDGSGIVQLDCPISHPGVIRREKFQIQSNGTISAVGGIDGQPPPASANMMPEEFSRFVLEPLLFPNG